MWVKGVMGGRLVLARRKVSVGSWADGGGGWSAGDCGELLPLSVLILSFGVALALDGWRGVKGVGVRGACAGETWSGCEGWREDVELVRASWLRCGCEVEVGDERVVELVGLVRPGCVIRLLLLLFLMGRVGAGGRWRWGDAVGARVEMATSGCWFAGDLLTGAGVGACGWEMEGDVEAAMGAGDPRREGEEPRAGVGLRACLGESCCWLGEEGLVLSEEFLALPFREVILVGLRVAGVAPPSFLAASNARSRSGQSMSSMRLHSASSGP
jgi:hypothetical protein